MKNVSFSCTLKPKELFGQPNTNDGKLASSQMKTKHLEEQSGSKPKEKGSILDGVCRSVSTCTCFTL